ncbi:MAG: peptidyl-prolyl cis-trans isomerase [Sandaracinaceae bacterium]|nr:peptidyl-prolyl cis-trans isomerase [Sandaracinaceae bacterium]
MVRRKTVRRALTTLSLLLSLGGASLLGDAAHGQAPTAPTAGRRAAPPAAVAAEPAGDTESQPVPAPADDAARTARRARVFSRLGQVTLTLGEIEDDIQRRSPFARRQFEDRERLVAHARELFRAKLLAHAASERGYGDKASVRTLVDRHLVAAVVRRQVDELNGPTQITTADARAYFDSHQELFVRAEQRRVSHILVESREQAAALLTQVRAGDLRVFRRLAQAESLDTETNQRGGDLGFFAADGRAAGGTDVAVNETIAQLAFTLTREEPVAREPLELTTTAGLRYSVVRLTASAKVPAPASRTWRPRCAGAWRWSGATEPIARTSRSCVSGTRCRCGPSRCCVPSRCRRRPCPAISTVGPRPRRKPSARPRGAAHMAPWPSAVRTEEATAHRAAAAAVPLQVLVLVDPGPRRATAWCRGPRGAVDSLHAERRSSWRSVRVPVRAVESNTV